MNLEIEELEEFIAEELQSKVGPKNKTIVEPYPDDPRKYNLLKRSAAILISFDNSSYSVPEAMRQRHDSRIKFMILTRSLRLDESSAYKLMRIIRKFISDLQPYSYVTGERSVGYDAKEGLHRHEVTAVFNGHYSAGA
jgi:hypothetical protein